jgi:hypothetical protein
VFLSTNLGTSWTSVNVGLTNTYVQVVAISGPNLFAGTSGGNVFLSTNSGANWTAVNTGLSDIDVRALVVSGTTLFAGTHGGVFVSTISGANWTAVNKGLAASNVYAFAVSGTNLFAGTGGGVWRRPLSEMIASIGVATSELPRVFFLHQNYPNPFNPSTTIKFELPRALEVNLTVFDILGREVSVLVKDRRDAGFYGVKLDGSNLASGVYFYRLQAGDFVATKRLLLLK